MDFVHSGREMWIGKKSATNWSKLTLEAGQPERVMMEESKIPLD